MMMLATVVEGRLIGINPYGQPGVEAYKKHMNEFLRKKSPSYMLAQLILPVAGIFQSPASAPTLPKRWPDTDRAG